MRVGVIGANRVRRSELCASARRTPILRSYWRRDSNAGSESLSSCPRSRRFIQRWSSPRSTHCRQRNSTSMFLARRMVTASTSSRTSSTRTMVVDLGADFRLKKLHGLFASGTRTSPRHRHCSPRRSMDWSSSPARTRRPTDRRTGCYPTASALAWAVLDGGSSSARDHRECAQWHVGRRPRHQ